jgi:hypothetical protein
MSDMDEDVRTVEIIMHLDVAELDGEHEFVWWAESPQMPEMTTTAGSTVELRRRLLELIPEYFASGDVNVVERLAEDFPARSDLPTPDAIDESSVSGLVLQRRVAALELDPSAVEGLVNA